VNTGTMEDESSNWRILTFGFHHVTVRSGLACVLNPIYNGYFLNFPNLFPHAVNRG
jgi:hypothetical protein